MSFKDIVRATADSMAKNRLNHLGKNPEDSELIILKNATVESLERRNNGENFLNSNSF